jgi:hypothetical protein
VSDPRRSVEETRQFVAERYRSVWFWLLWTGVMLAFAAMVGVIYNISRYARHGTPLEIGSVAMMIVGLTLAGVAFIRRNAYHRRRYSGS